MVAVKTRNPIPPFPQPQLEAIAKVLADTTEGLTGTELGHALQSCKITDVDPQNTKWKRLYNAFAEFQNKHNVGNYLIVFIRHVMDPAFHVASQDRFKDWQAGLNRILSLSGMEVGNDGKIRRAQKAATLDDAVARAGRLKSKLEARNAHANVLKYCRAEIVAENYFHAVLEAMKSITGRVRKVSGLDGEGAKLVQGALGGQAPILKINPLKTETQQGEQRGFVSLLTGMYGMIRNPIAHEPRIEWNMSEQDALDIMTTISYVHRKLDFSDK